MNWPHPLLRGAAEMAASPIAPGTHELVARPGDLSAERFAEQIERVVARKALEAAPGERVVVDVPQDFGHVYTVGLARGECLG